MNAPTKMICRAGRIRAANMAVRKMARVLRHRHLML